MKVFVLGHRGMLGHVVKRYLEEQKVDVSTTKHRWPSSEFKKKIKEYRGDYTINCIGAIPQKRDKFQINYKIPTWLDINSSTKVIHPASDSEENIKGYQQSKYIASHWIKNNSKNTKIIKSSIIGPELQSNFSLMEWVLSQTEEVTGYKNYFWNGNTTLTWAKQCYKILNNWDSYEKEIILEGECISKYELLSTIEEVFNKKLKITPINSQAANKCLKGGIKTPLIRTQITELKSWIDQNKFLYL